jgi:hypothetical protein
MRTYNLVSFLILATLVLSCSKKPAFKQFDAAAWSSDAHGCNGIRKGLTENLLKERDQLLARDEMEVFKVLGKPDAHEIYKRSEKFFYYSIDPDSTCARESEHAKKLVIRFNAVGLAKEIVVEKK